MTKSNDNKKTPDSKELGVFNNRKIFSYQLLH